MPELPEVETVVAGLKPQVVGKTLISVTNSGKNLRYPLPDFSVLHQSTVIDVVRRAKYLLFHFENGLTLVWHLGMTGQFHVLNQVEPTAKHEHICLTFQGHSTLRYRDVRRFGYAGICSTEHLHTHVWFKNLGLEPLTDVFDAKHLQNMLKNKKIHIKQAIMDNHIVVGVGNIYASESLFRSAISPTTPSNTLSLQKLKKLVQNIKDVLAEAIEAGGSTISDFVKADGKPGYFSHSFKVYGRDGKACLVCQQPIQRIVQNGRASFFCAKCQS